MTQRKPAGIRFESWIDRQIRRAAERGEFEDLPGHPAAVAGASIGDAPETERR